MPPSHHKGRGAISQTDSRFETRPVEIDDEEAARLAAEAPETVLTAMRAKKIISHNDSPDVPFDRSINPYQGCEHGCIYCYARPSHSYLDLSPGLDFESRIFYKPNAASCLVEEWEKRSYVCQPITIGANTDPYQPAERKLRVTRQLLEEFRRYSHPVNIITKSHRVLEDIDLLADLAARRLCSVAISIPTMQDSLKRVMEPRVPSAEARLKTIRKLVDAGIPVSVLMAPVIPALNDNEIERIIEATADAGASHAHYIFLRLPHEVKTIFVEWLRTHFPDRANRVMNLIRQASGGRDYDYRFTHRQTGRGAYADMIGSRFRTASRRHGLTGERYQRPLDCQQFTPPGRPQLGLDLGYS
jgi:DNA repair photolyase